MLRFIRPALPGPEEWLPYLEPAYKRKWFSNFGPVHEFLERRLTEKYAGPSRKAILVASATAGLTATLMALGVRGRVLLPAFTFPATLQAVRAAGCVPVFADVCAAAWEMSAETLQAGLLEGGIAAVMIVRSYGFCRDLRPMEEICREAGIPLIVDAAAALGGRTAAGVAIGGQGIAEVFSLHATKVFGIGEGGVVFAPEDLVTPIRAAINFGIQDGKIGLGFNGKLSEFPCAVGLAMLNQIDAHLETRRRVASRYIERFQSLHELTLPAEPGAPPWQSFPVRLRCDQHAAEFVERAQQSGLEARRYYRPALDRSAVVSQELASTVVCLPVYSDMTECEQDSIIRIVQACLLK